MKRSAALAVLVAVGVLAGRALADPLPPLPAPQPVPTVTLPSLPVLPPAVPKLPLPSNPAPASPVQAAVGQAAVPLGSVSAPSLGLGSSGSGTSFSSGASPSSSSPRSTPGTVEHFNSTRPWIGTTGPEKRRTTTLTFVLPRAARVVFTVKQVAPVCRAVGTFTVAGHVGLNRVRFRGRVHGEPLDAGTYRISARIRGGSLVRRVTIVVVDGPAPSRGELAAARAADVCVTMRATGAATAAPGPQVFAKGESVLGAFRPEHEASASGPSVGSASRSGGVLASTAQKAAHAVRPVLLALLVLSILLLGIAALPATAVPEPRVNELLARHRIEIAGLGAAALVAVAVAFLLG